MLKIAVIGCGAIGGELVRSIKEGFLRDVKVVALLDINREKAIMLAKELGDENLVVDNLDELLDRNPDVIVEAASPYALKEIARKILEADKTLIAMSSGALLDRKFYEEVMSIINSGKGRLYIPSGAIGGVDILKAVSQIGGNVRLITIKSKEAFKKAKNLDKLGIDIEKIDKRTLVFKGKASEAIKYFPTMINVSATISLAFGRDIDVEIYADPTIHYTVHEIEIETDATIAKVILDNKHHPRNPKTSYLAPLSLIRLIKRLTERVQIGT